MSPHYPLRDGSLLLKRIDKQDSDHSDADEDGNGAQEVEESVPDDAGPLLLVTRTPLDGSSLLVLGAQQVVELPHSWPLSRLGD
eukprot:CAMPEP_0174316846 /NCGR_PEP_ID=MMETSP0810-20121108/7223_1 /TAXON_ID=73025 ORGANISM="Eutreptiella gymnastica-like, Strain CCMP1594" /NCGR_SAMPLE_ID=MMETSP0810 /ASSEMBLY_ACC=CAM_ASM_000659 /LENGTH=83 /DNA_ID=CAMNT_0015426697 /DNA_START=443 /DNA_END=694 /DNA_ORIENTATION=+